MQSRETLLFSYSKSWAKKEGEHNFDVSMCCYHGAEVYELVGTYLLSQLKAVTAKENMSLYRDNGLGIFKKMFGPEVERKKRTCEDI